MKSAPRNTYATLAAHTSLELLCSTFADLLTTNCFDMNTTPADKPPSAPANANDANEAACTTAVAGV